MDEVLCQLLSLTSSSEPSEVGFMSLAFQVRKLKLREAEWLVYSNTIS